MSNRLVEFIRDIYRSNDFIPLHAPMFNGREKDYVLQCIDSTFVSSVGAFVDQFESQISEYTGSPAATATVNGTAALHVALKIVGVEPGDYVITQSLTFVATCNAIAYCGAEPVFVDVSKATLGMSPKALESWLEENTRVNDEGQCVTVQDNRIVRACLPMHTFGHPCDLTALQRVTKKWNIILVEDAAESLGSFYKDQHTGTFGSSAAISFNGNKIITTGGGGVILASEHLARKAKHLTTTAKQPHSYEYVHDEVGYNYRLPNLNAALGCAQLEKLETHLKSKRELATRYELFFADSAYKFFKEPEYCRSNYWLNAVICEDLQQQSELIQSTNLKGVTTRPIWKPMHQLKMYSRCPRGKMDNTEWLNERVVNLPSSVTPVASS